MAVHQRTIKKYSLIRKDGKHTTLFRIGKGKRLELNKMRVSDFIKSYGDMTLEEFFSKHTYMGNPVYFTDYYSKHSKQKISDLMKRDQKFLAFFKD